MGLIGTILDQRLRGAEVAPVINLDGLVDWHRERFPDAGGGGTNTLVTVPEQETWQLFLMSWNLIQTGGTIAVAFFVNVGPDRQAHHPFFVDAAGEAMTGAGILNGTSRVALAPRTPIMLGPGDTIVHVETAGDGTVTQTSPTLFFRKFFTRQLMDP